ncbi:MAG: hypothetical protein PHC51_12450 [bacterium]|nr:hypothetical protein [bacterium]
MLVTLAIVIVVGIGASSVLIHLIRKKKAALIEVLSKESTGSDTDASALHAAIAHSLDRLEQMIPWDQAVSVHNETKKMLDERDACAKQIAQLEKELDIQQGEIDAREKKHNKLKEGKGDAERLAEEIKATQAQLKAESNRLQSQINDSVNQMEVLSAEVSLSAEQTKQLKNIQETLKNLGDRLKMLTKTREQSANRFITLENQYRELEIEYRKLIEKELNDPS